MIHSVLAALLVGISLAATPACAQFTTFYPSAAVASGGAIAFDAATQSNSGNWSSGTTVSWTHPVSAAGNPYLVVGVAIFNSGHGSTPTVSTLTYNSVGCTIIGTALQDSVQTADYMDTEWWSCKAPSTGAHSIAVTLSSSATVFQAQAQSYTGADQTAPVDSFNAQQSFNTATATGSTTVVASGSWLAGFAFARTPSAISAGAGTTVRIQSAVSQTQAMGDSNGTVSTGSQSLNWDAGGSSLWMGILTMSIKHA